MGFDALVLKSLVDELSTTLPGSRVQRAYQPARDEIILALATGGRETHLVISLHPTLFHIRLSDKLEGPNTPPGSLGLLLRRHLEGMRFKSVQQTPYEREVILSFEGSEYEFPRPRYQLQVRLIPRATDLVLSDGDGRVLGAHLPQQRPDAGAETPQATSQIRPDLESREHFAQAILFAAEETGLADLLLKHYRGISPAVAREIVFRAGLPVTAKRGAVEEVDALWSSFSGVIEAAEAGRWTPGIATGGPIKGEELSAITLNHAGAFRPFPAASAAVSAYFAERDRRERLVQSRGSMLRHIKNLHARGLRKAAAQEGEVLQADKASEHRHYGELLLANLSALRRGEPQAVVTDYATGETVAIPLDPAHTPADNAQIYFKRYQKAKRAQTAAEEQLARTRKEVEYLAQVQLSLDQAETLTEVEQIREELEEQGYLRQRSKAAGRNAKAPGFGPRRYATSDGYEVLVGRNNRENDRLTLKSGGPDDWWLHAKDIPGAHVILRAGQTAEPSETALLEAAAIAAWYSQARGATRVAVDYTRRRHVWKASGGKPGMVNYDHQRTLSVMPALPS